MSVQLILIGLTTVIMFGEELLYCDVESKWKNYHITTFHGQSLPKTGLSLEEAMDLSRDKQIEEEEEKSTNYEASHYVITSIFLLIPFS
jgi:hypothetical protein